MVLSDKPSFLQPIEDELNIVENMLDNSIKSSVRLAVDVTSHIIDAGGKRLRPALTLLSAHLCEITDIKDLIDISTAIEMIHMAALMHDDVVDEAMSRRGVATANFQWGNKISVLSGDYTVAKAFYLVSECRNEAIMRSLAGSATKMAESELKQLEVRDDINAMSDCYLSIIEGKTASFISSCCEVGAMIADADEHKTASLASYGLNVGMAFQITDDILDLVGDPEVTGKPAGSDIIEGKLTLPIINTLKESDENVRSEISRIILSRSAADSEIDYIIKAADTCNAVSSSRNTAAEYVDAAINNLSEFAENEYRKSLENLAEAIVSRNM